MVKEGDAEGPFIARRIASRIATGVTVLDADPLEGGLTIQKWIDLWLNTHDQGRRTEWPDGGCLLQQPAIAVAMLDLVGTELIKEAEAQAGK
jgi:hypothetical protein